MNDRLIKIKSIDTDRPHNCPHCHRAQTARCHDLIVLGRNPNWDVISAYYKGSVFLRKCTACKKEYNFFYPITYVDGVHNFILYYPCNESDPKTVEGRFYYQIDSIFKQSGIHIDPRTAGEFDSKGTPCRIVKNFFYVRDKINTLGNSLDDRVLALIKADLKQQYEAKHRGTKVDCIFFEALEGNDMKMTVVIKGKGYGVIYKNAAKEYEQYKKSLLKVLNPSVSNTSFYINDDFGMQAFKLIRQLRTAPRQPAPAHYNTGAPAHRPANPAYHSPAPIHRPMPIYSHNEESASSGSDYYYNSSQDTQSSSVPGYMEVHTDPYRAMMEGGSDGYTVTNTPDGTFYGPDGYYPYSESAGSYEHFTYQDGSVPFE